MKYLPLLFANLKRKKVRTLLTIGSFVVALFLFGVGIGLRGVAFPWLLFRAQRAVTVRREVEPFVSTHVSVSIAAGLVIIAFVLPEKSEAFTTSGLHSG